jgi:ElaB/YqjD/DUF883 family membrane-anchored ribosome-binding protein
MKQPQSLKRLVSDVEELLSQLSEDDQPAIQELRARIRDAIDSTKQTRKGASGPIRRYAMSIDNYITSYPRMGFITGLVLGGLIVYTASLFGSEE